MGLKLPHKSFACPGVPNPVGSACLADRALLLGEDARSQGSPGTCADGPDILMGSTLNEQAKVLAPAQVGLSPVHGTWSREMGPKPLPHRLLLGATSPAAGTAPRHPAGPGVITHCPPGAVMVDLNEALTPASCCWPASPWADLWEPRARRA